MSFYLWFPKYRTYALEYPLPEGQGMKTNPVAVWIWQLNPPGLCRLAIEVYSKMVLISIER